MKEMWLEDDMKTILVRRAEKGSLRVYQEYQEDGSSLDAAVNSNNNNSEQPLLSSPNIDFASNDYLGLARDTEQKQRVDTRYQALLAQQQQQPVLGATGSRLLSGDSIYARRLEQRLARWHGRPAALLFNSGYDANLSVLSCLPCYHFLLDEYAHNSLRMGMRLSRTFRDQNTKVSGLFLHNNVQDLRNQLEAIEAQPQSSSSYTTSTTTTRRTIRTLIVVESVYSMDGDVAPLQAMLDLALEFGAMVLVDEAHGVGIFGDDAGHSSRGTGVLTQLQLESHPALACSIHTFGKAAGCHGAVVCGSLALRQYLWNYGWPLIYSTAMPLHSLVAIECSYETMTSLQGKALRRHTQRLVDLFRNLAHERIVKQQHGQNMYLLPSTSPIQALVLPQNGNQACTEFCQRMWAISKHTIQLYPIKSPTVPEGMERIRIIVHGHNTPIEVHKLVDCMAQCLMDMKLLGQQSNKKLYSRL